MTYEPTLVLSPYHDNNEVECSRHRYPFHPDSQTDSYNYHHLGEIPRPAPSYSFRRLTDENLKCTRSLGWSIDWAVAFIVDHLSPVNSPDAGAVLRKICDRVQRHACEGSQFSLPYQAFPILNQILFASHLKDAVFLDVRPMGLNISGKTYAHGHGPNRRVRRISIVLNSDTHHETDGRQIIASLIHHMIHAYFMVACGPQDEKEVGYGRLDHGVQFAQIMRTIKDLSKDRRGTPGLPHLGFRQRLAPSRRYYEDYSSGPSRLDSKEWYCSHCSTDVPAIPNCDVQKWYGGVCKPLLELPETLRKSTVLIYNKHNELEEVPRAQTTPSGESIEFLLDGKTRSVLVPVANIRNFVSILRAMEKVGCRYIEILPDVPVDGFMAMLELLHTGNYGPDIASVYGAGQSGPPIIKPVHANSPPYLQRDIHVFKTGVEMGFEDLMGISLERMRSQCVTREDPIAVLKEIYDKKEPHSKLRQWTRDFLVQAPYSEGEWGMGRCDEEPANLIKLRTEMCFRERFAALRERYAALHIDELKAEEVLLASCRASPARMLLNAAPHGRPRSLSPSRSLGLGMIMPPRARTLGLGWRDGFDEYELERFKEQRLREDMEAVYAARLDRDMRDRFVDRGFYYA